MSLKLKKKVTKISSILVILSTLLIYSCEPEYCANCYDNLGLFRDKVIVICADNLDDLCWLMDESEYMGYECMEDR